MVTENSIFFHGCRIENEISRKRDVSQWKLSCVTGQISLENKHILYSKEGFMSKENCWGTQYIDIGK